MTAEMPGSGRCRNIDVCQEIGRHFVVIWDAKSWTVEVMRQPRPVPLKLEMELPDLMFPCCVSVLL